MTDDEVKVKLTEIFRDVFDDESLEITPETTAADIRDWDSVNQIMILMASEVAFNIKFGTAETEGLRNVGELISVIRQKVG
jgi:acyl carrier protein